MAVTAEQVMQRRQAKERETVDKLASRLGGVLSQLEASGEGAGAVTALVRTALEQGSLALLRAADAAAVEYQFTRQ